MTESRIILALDYADAASAAVMVGRLQPGDCRLKVGLELYTAAGPDFVRLLVDKGFDVFLDLKFHDIPTTVAAACRRAAALGVWMMNVHSLGGKAMMRAAREAIDATDSRPRLIGVTLLTSHDQTEVQDIGLTGGLTDQVDRLARFAHSSGLDGVVCSPREAERLRKDLGPGFLLVTPGIRPQGSSRQDQQRVLTPAEAVSAGADYLVIGRPITGSKDPIAALREIAGSLEGLTEKM
jgi:orotidine-5'-phosphate decarboxylase